MYRCAGRWNVESRGCSTGCRLARSGGGGIALSAKVFEIEAKQVDLFFAYLVDTEKGEIFT